MGLLVSALSAAAAKLWQRMDRNTLAASGHRPVRPRYLVPSLAGHQHVHCHIYVDHGGLEGRSVQASARHVGPATEGGHNGASSNQVPSHIGASTLEACTRLPVELCGQVTSGLPRCDCHLDVLTAQD